MANNSAVVAWWLTKPVRWNPVLPARVAAASVAALVEAAVTVAALAADVPVAAATAAALVVVADTVAALVAVVPVAAVDTAVAVPAAATKQLSACIGLVPVQYKQGPLGPFFCVCAARFCSATTAIALRR